MDKKYERKGRNISPANLAEIFKFIENFQPQNKIEERDKLILEFAFVHNMSALQIGDLKDDRIVGYGHRNNGKHLTGESISRIIKSYDLVHEKRIDYTNRSYYGRRKDLTTKKNAGKIKRKKECCFCGSKKNLELHHMIWLSMGGSDSDWNLVYMCDDCHKMHHKFAIQEQ